MIFKMYINKVQTICVIICCTAGIMMVSSFDTVRTGKEVFTKYCKRCHGDDGTKGSFKAKNLQESTKTDKEIYDMVLNGKKPMPAYEKKLSVEEINNVVAYTKSLRK